MSSRLVILLLSWVTVAPAAAAADPITWIEPTPLASAVDGKGLSKARRKLLAGLCKDIASQLEIGKGPGKRGVFLGHTCEVPAARQPAPSPASPWRLAISGKKRAWTVSLHYDDGVCKEKIGAVSQPWEAINDVKTRPPLLAKIADFFLDSLPMSGRVESGAVALQSAETRVYRLGIDRQSCFWITEDSRLGKDPKALLGQPPLLKGAWMHRAEGRGALAPTLLAEVDRMAKEAKDKAQKKEKKSSLMSLLTDGQILTARLGLPVIRSNALLAKTKQVGLGLSMHRGPAEGLTVAADFVPKTKGEIDGVASSIEWSRWSIGYAFRFKPGFVDRIDVIPHLGAWSFAATLPQTTPDGQRVAETFEFKRALSGGVEFAVLKAIGPVYTSPHCGTDLAYALPSQNSQITVGSQRCGLDLSFSRLKTRGFFPYAFANYEVVGLRDERTSGGAEGYDVSTRTVTYAELYLGGGATYEW